MKKSGSILLMMLCLLMASCTTSRTTVSQPVDLSKYATMVDVMSYHGSAALMDAEIKIYDAIDNSRLRMIGYQAINELTDEQKQQLLLERFCVTQKDEESVVTVNFASYFYGRPIASYL